MDSPGMKKRILTIIQSHDIIAKKAEKAKSKTYTERQSRGSAFQTVDKPLYFLKMGSQGRSPRQGLGAVAPAK